MKKFLLLLIFSILLVACYTTSNDGIEISGYVKNSEKEYIHLNYLPRLRGNLSFDNFTSIGSNIDSEGYFNLNSDKITDGANYSLEFKNNGIQLILFRGDNIQLDFDVNNPKESLFAIGKGAGKINTLNLKQFGYDNFDFENIENINEFSNHIEDVISGQISLLNYIYLKKQNDKIVLESDNKAKIQKIIANSPLTEKEYKFLLNRINFQRYSLQTNFLNKISGLKNLDSIEINFKDKAFKHFSKKEYQKLNNINDWHLANNLESILQIEYLKKLVEQDSVRVTYGNWQSFFNNSDYKKWANSFLKDNLNGEIYNKYYADLSTWLMTLGADYKTYSDNLDPNKSNKYLKKINEFENLLENGLDNKAYALNKDTFTLDKLKFESLLEKYKGKPLLITFWSAQFAGSSLVNNLPSIKNFTKANKEKINVINICIDKEVNKKVWAARIIDNEWKSKHYFLPIEKNDSILNKFSDKKISAFCDGGVTYAFINKNGTINNGIKFPFHLSTEKIDKMIK
ncbi:hypothetical protein [Zobellia alginiliquefaciens]|uniref:hypothetical protein n=1 Tax=Zobellia alginiliquefaciens TaxID=3032586 RepID=UPI0023E357E3|nr:hypothetical protein [Zobellia alginiliquefaciens]